MGDFIVSGTVTVGVVTRETPGALRWVVPDHTTTEMPTLEQHFYVEAFGDKDKPIAVREEWRPVPTIVRRTPR